MSKTSQRAAVIGFRSGAPTLERGTAGCVQVLAQLDRERTADAEAERELEERAEKPELPG